MKDLLSATIVMISLSIICYLLILISSYFDWQEFKNRMTFKEYRRLMNLMRDPSKDPVKLRKLANKAIGYTGF